MPKRTRTKANEQRKKNPAAVALGRRGGLKGGPARAKKLTADERRKSASHAATARAAQLSTEERKAIARKAANARWKK
jgi:hypothetical protein